MRSRRWRLWGLTVLGGFLALGCEKALVKPDYPPDPVLISKRPVEGQVTTSSHPVVVRHEPVIPPLPETAVASAPSTLSSSARTTTAKPLYPAPEHPPAPSPTPAGPPVESKAPPTPPEPARPRPVTGTYGHAPDYTWLQGVVDRHYLGHTDLRFCDPSTEDEWGGKVCFADDARLKQFKDGDVVFVEGELVTENGRPKTSRAHHYPLYRIRHVEAARPKP